MRLSHDLPCRLCRLVFTSVILLAWAGLPQAQVARAQAQPANDAADVKALADWVGGVLRAVEESDRLLPRDTFDPAAVVAAVGKDPAKLLEWVRTETAWVPYRGALRGARGVLMDRVGNSLDRSQLLAELLRGAGHTARLARAELTEAQAAALRERLAAAPAKKDAPAADAWEKSLDQQAKELGVDPARLRRDVEKLAAPVARISEDLAQRVADQVPALLQALGEAPPADAAAPAGAGADVAALRDHWWVQRRDGGNWVDLDPAGPDPAPAAAATVELPADPAKLPVDATLSHQVTIRVVIEQWKEGRLKQSPVLEHALRPAETVGQRVVFANTPIHWPGNLDLAAEADPGAKVRGLLLQQDGWIPCLRVGDATITRAAFTNDGEIDPKPNLDAIANAGKSVAAAVDKAASLLNDLDAPAPAPGAKASGGVLTGEWLEYEIRVPGSEPVRVRRDVFDLVGPAARAAAAAQGTAVPAPASGDAQKLERALALGGTSEIVLLGAGLSSEYVQHLLNQNLLAGRNALNEMLKSGGAGDERGALRPVEKLSPMPVQPYLFAVARFVWSRGRDRTFLATPNVVAFHRRFGTGAGGGLTRRTIFDIVANEVAIRPGAAKDGADGFRLRLEQGVVDSNLESQLVTARPPEEGGVKVNTADLYARSEAQGVKWVTVRGADADAALAGVSLGADVKQRVKDDLAAGYAVVLPTKPVDMGGVKAGGWWRVDPRTGSALGMTEAGGATFAEYALQITASLAVGVWTFIGCGGLTGSGPKKLGCAVCAVAAAVLTYLAFAAGFAAAAAAAGEAAPTGAVASAATAVGTTGGAAGVGGVNVACNALSGLAS